PHADFSNRVRTFRSCESTDLHYCNFGPKTYIQVDQVIAKS
ncbi:27823_t:CDS:1, partial [Gigaspora margarita]